MAWPLEQCPREHSHAPHTWKPKESEAAQNDGYVFCSGMEKIVSAELTESPCQRWSQGEVHSPHHWDQRVLYGTKKESCWCPGIFTIESAAITTQPNVGLPFSGGEVLERLHCGSARPHKGHQHYGPISSGVEPRFAYWCKGQPEYEQPPLTDSRRYIVTKLLPEVAEHMIEAGRHYGDNHRTLGPRGQFADIWRKIGPLKRAMWEGAELTRETPRQILIDLIGHALLTVEMIDHEVPPEGEGV
jgi:hypothetical protein